MTILATYTAAILIVALCLFAGRAVMVACGRREWSGIEPAVGFAAVVAVQGLLARFPASGSGLVLGLIVIFAVSAFLLRKPASWKLPGSPWLWAGFGLTLLLTAVPFIISGRWGLLGMGYNNDLGLHLAWAESLRSGFGTEPSPGYPLGPHGLVTSLSYLPGIGLGTAFIGLVVAIPALTVMTAWFALDRLGNARRLLAALLVAGPYLMVSYFAQAAFKETATATLLLAFTIALPAILPLADRHREWLRLSAPAPGAAGRDHLHLQLSGPRFPGCRNRRLADIRPRFPRPAEPGLGVRLPEAAPGGGRFGAGSGLAAGAGLPRAFRLRRRLRRSRDQ